MIDMRTCIFIKPPQISIISLKNSPDYMATTIHSNFNKDVKGNI